MKHTINGLEVSWDGLPTGVTVVQRADRLVVRTPQGTHTALARRVGDLVWISYRGESYRLEPMARQRAAEAVHATGDTLAPMPGQVVEVLVRAGETVEIGQRLVVVEAMKTHITLTADRAGTVERIAVAPGDAVTDGTLLVRIRAGDAPAAGGRE